MNLVKRSSSCNSEESDDLEGQKVVTTAKVQPKQAAFKTYVKDNARQHGMKNKNAQSCKSPILPPSTSDLSSITPSTLMALDTPPPTPSPILPQKVSFDHLTSLSVNKQTQKNIYISYMGTWNSPKFYFC